VWAINPERRPYASLSAHQHTKFEDVHFIRNINQNMIKMCSFLEQL